MLRKKESDFAEIMVDKLFLESFANEQSAYHTDSRSQLPGDGLEKFRSKLRWHIDHSLSKRQKQVIKYYLNGKKERQIAQILGVAQQVVNIYKWRAIKKLQRVMAS